MNKQNYLNVGMLPLTTSAVFACCYMPRFCSWVEGLKWVLNLNYFSYEFTQVHISKTVKELSWDKYESQQAGENNDYVIIFLFVDIKIASFDKSTESGSSESGAVRTRTKIRKTVCRMLDPNNCCCLWQHPLLSPFFNVAEFFFSQERAKLDGNTNTMRGLQL